VKFRQAAGIQGGYLRADRRDRWHNAARTILRLIPLSVV
jgi:hypothetical protein